jgi:hypothetical protein
MQTLKSPHPKRGGRRGPLGLALALIFAVLSHSSYSAEKDSEIAKEICKKVEAVIDISFSTDLFVFRRAAEAILLPQAKVCNETGYCYPSVQAFFENSTDILFLRHLIRRDVNQLASACEKYFTREFKKGYVEGRVINGSPVETTVKELIENGFSPIGGFVYEFVELPNNSKISVELDNWGDKSKNFSHQCVDFNRYFEQNDMKDQTLATKEPICFDVRKVVSEAEFDERLSKILDRRLGIR